MSLVSKKVFILEKDQALVYVYRIFLEEIGYQFMGSASSLEEASRIVSTLPQIDIVLLDVDVARSTEEYVEFSTHLFAKYDILVIYLMADLTRLELKKLMSSNFYGYILLPAQTEVFKMSLEFALKKYEYEQKHFIEHRILNNINLGTVIFKLDGEVVFVNDTVVKHFGIHVGDNVTQKLKGRFFKIDNTFINSLIGSRFKEIILEREVEYKTLYYNLQFSVYNVRRREPLIYCFIYDFSANKNIVSKKSETNTFLKRVLNNIDDGIFIIDRGLKLVDYNDISEVFFSETFDISLSFGMHVKELFFFLSQDQEKAFTQSLLVVFKGISRSMVRHFIFKDNPFWFRIKLFPVLKNEETGKYDLVAISIQNLTREKLLELKINELETEVKPLFDSSFQRFYLCDLDFKIISYNKAAFDVILKEFNHKLKKGDSILNFVPKEVGIEKFKEYFDRTLNYEHVFFKIKIHADNVGEYWNETHMDPVVDSKGEIHEVLIWTIDVTEQEKNMQALRESEERYSLIANGANDGLWDWDLKTNKVYLSPRWKALLGYSDDELSNEFGIHDSLIHPDDKERSQEVLRKYLQGEIDEYVNEIRLKHKNGHYIWVLERGVALRDENGNIVRLAGSITDITKQKKIEQKLKDAYLQLMQERQMFIDADIVIFKMKVNKSPQITYITKNVSKILGYSAEEIVSNRVSLYDMIHPEDLLSYKKNLIQLRNAPKNSQSFKPIRFRKANGEYVWLKSFVIIISKTDKEVEVRGHFMDVSEILEARRILTERQKSILEFISNANDAIIGIDTNGKILDYNKKALSYFSLSDDKELKGRNISDFLEKTETNKTWSEIFAEASRGEANLYVFKLKSHSKKTDATETEDRYVEISVNPIKVKDVTSYYLIIRDITKRKLLEKETLRNKMRYEALVNAIPDLIFVMDKDGYYVDYTADKNTPLYTEPENIVGKHLRDFFEDEEKMNEILEKIRDTIQTGKLNKVKYSMNSPIGRRYFEARISKMDDERILSIVRDITDWKQ